MLASLPMYDREELQPVNDRFWHKIRAALGEGPEYLTRAGDVWDHWASPDLVLSQTCGYPYRARLHGAVTLVGTPDHDLEGCPPGHYCSVFVARADDQRSDPAEFAESVFAYSEPLSQSGWAAPQNYARDQGFAFTRLRRTGAHAASARDVDRARADLAAIDAVSWAMMQRHDDFASRLKEVGRTPPTPALPYITALTRDPAPIFYAIAAAIDTMPAEDLDALCLRGIVRIPAEEYLAVPNPPRPEEI